jgi:hypothetical protein
MIMTEVIPLVTLNLDRKKIMTISNLSPSLSHILIETSVIIPILAPCSRIKAQTD